MKRKISVAMAVALMVTVAPMQGFAEDAAEKNYAETEGIETKYTETEQDSAELSEEVSAQDTTEPLEDAEEETEQILEKEMETNDETETEDFSDILEESADNIEIIDMEEVDTVSAVELEADGTGEENGFSYVVLEDGTAEITRYKGTEEEELVIPDSINGYPVTSIGNSAFYGCSGFTGNLTIPEGVTSIGISAFDGCSGFTGNLSIPESVTSIGGYAFEYCSGFTKLTLQGELLNVGEDAFYGCNFTDGLEFSEGWTRIPDNFAANVFSSCGFSGSLTLPEGLISIGKAAFNQMDEDGWDTGLCMFEGDIVLPSSLTSINSDNFGGNTILNKSEVLKFTENSTEKWYHVENEEIVSSGTVPTGKLVNIIPSGRYIDFHNLWPWLAMLNGGKALVRTLQDVNGNYGLPDEYLSWVSSDETVATVDSNGIVTAVGEGDCNIGLYLKNTDYCYIGGHVYVYGDRPTVSGDLTWHIPKRIKLGFYFYQKQLASLRLWEGGVPELSYLEVHNISEDNASHLGIVGNWTDYFVKYIGGYPLFLRPADTALYNMSMMGVSYPGTATFQAAIVENGEVVQTLGEPYTVIIEEPVISTNEPESVTTGDTITLCAELQNTDLANLPVKDTLLSEIEYYENRIHGTGVVSPVYFPIVYQPEYIIESGADLIELSNGDFTHTLNASEQIRFKGEGTVKIKVKYRQVFTSYDASHIIGLENGFYEPEKTVTIQVKPERNSGTELNQGQDPNSGAGQSPDQNLDQGRTGVSPAAVPVSSIALDKAASVAQGESITLKADIAPADASDKSVTWSSSNLKVALVDENGTVTGKHFGVVFITAAAADGSGISAQCKVTVGRKGYQVKNWYSDKKARKKVKDTDAAAASGKMLYAEWVKISLKKAVITSLKNSRKKKAVLKIKKIKAAEGYEIVYGTNKKLKKNVQTIMTKKPSAILKGLTKKTYFVKVRAYKTDSTGAKVYGKYSAVKKIKISK